MRVVYNGIDLQVLETYEFSAEPVFDDTGTDYLYTKYAITVRAIINGQADILRGTRSAIDGRLYSNGPVMTYDMTGALVVPASNNLPAGGFVNATPGFNNAGAPVANDRPNPFNAAPRNARGGFLGPEPGVTLPATGLMFSVVPVAVTTNITHASVRQRLTTPRGQLFVFSGPLAGGGPVEMMLASPVLSGGVPAPCDARNGPFPRLFSVHQAFGDANTLLIDFSVETFVNEAWANGVDNSGTRDRTRGMVSNRFKQIHRVTKDGYSTIATTGTAIFRVDALMAAGAFGNPDMIRDSLFMPIPVGFTREDITVEGLPEAFGVRYQYADVQTPVNFSGGQSARAASIAVVHRQAISSGDILGGALSAYERITGIRANKHIADSNKDETDKNVAPVRPAAIPDTPAMPHMPGASMT